MAIKLVSSEEFATVANVATFDALSQCVNVAVENGKLCLRLPIGIGNVCVDIPDVIPNGTVAEACIELGFPACVKLTVKALGQTFTWNFGSC